MASTFYHHVTEKLKGCVFSGFGNKVIKYPAGEGKFKPHQDTRTVTSNVVGDGTLIICLKGDGGCPGTRVFVKKGTKIDFIETNTPGSGIMFEKTLWHEGLSCASERIIITINIIMVPLEYPWYSCQFFVDDAAHDAAPIIVSDTHSTVFTRNYDSYGRVIVEPKDYHTCQSSSDDDNSDDDDSDDDSDDDEKGVYNISTLFEERSICADLMFEDDEEKAVYNISTLFEERSICADLMFEDDDNKSMAPVGMCEFQAIVVSTYDDEASSMADVVAWVVIDGRVLKASMWEGFKDAPNDDGVWGEEFDMRHLLSKYDETLSTKISVPLKSVAHNLKRTRTIDEYVVQNDVGGFATAMCGEDCCVFSSTGQESRPWKEYLKRINFNKLVVEHVESTMEPNFRRAVPYHKDSFDPGYIVERLFVVKGFIRNL